ncbi:MAG: TfoX/Sxy family protein [Hyphomicrobiales bacterium]
MDAQSIADVFAGFAPVRLRRMFSGHGIYADELIFALEIGGEIFLKVDAQTEAQFAAVGSQPFTYDRAGKSASMAYWRMPQIAFDDEEELTRWCNLALDAARRASVRKQLGRKPAKPVKRKPIKQLGAARRAGRGPARSR